VLTKVMGLLNSLIWRKLKVYSQETLYVFFQCMLNVLCITSLTDLPWEYWARCVYTRAVHDYTILLTSQISHIHVLKPCNSVDKTWLMLIITCICGFTCELYLWFQSMLLWINDILNLILQTFLPHGRAKQCPPENSCTAVKSNNGHPSR
jgi:hypothetical protein